jgi:hypothetical protein
MAWQEILGYVASVLTAASLMMTSHVRLRLLNLVGSAVFATYGLLIGAYPVAALNLFIVAVNIFFLLRIARTKTLFTLLPMPARDAYFDEFLRVHAKDIAAFFPDFSPDAVVSADAGGLSLYLLRNAVTAGVFAARRDPADPGTAVVALDYVTPEFRDYRTARFLFSEQADFFRRAGVRRVVAAAHVPAHAKYLARVGFRPLPPTEGGPALYELEFG